MPNTMRYFCDICGDELFSEWEIIEGLCDDCEDEDDYYYKDTDYDEDHTEEEMD